jgi:hypothetical protein
MTTLREHIQIQQDTASDLEGVLEALQALHSEGMVTASHSSLINVAHCLAARLSKQLDPSHLPGGAGLSV